MGEQPKPFVLNIDPTLIYGPNADPPLNYVKGKHPYWKSYPDGVPDQFIDPNWGNRSIGYVFPSSFEGGKDNL